MSRRTHYTKTWTKQVLLLRLFVTWLKPGCPPDCSAQPGTRHMAGIKSYPKLIAWAKWDVPALYRDLEVSMLYPGQGNAV